MTFVAWLVKRRTRSSLSRNKVAMSVLSRRFFMSLFVRESSSTLALSSWLTVCISSFMDCISSFEVVSSSFVDWSSSFVDCNSSLVDFSSSWEVCISSRVVCSSSRACRSSSSIWASRAATAGVRRVLPGAFVSGGAATSVKTIITMPRKPFRLDERLDGEVQGLRPRRWCPLSGS